MINNLEFTNRIDRMLKFYDLTASAFADKIEVQRSSISHLLAGRNKPSLEFVMKVVRAFPEVDLHWLLYGKGSFPAKTRPVQSNNAQEGVNKSTGARKESIADTKTIDKIVIFYSDGTFRAYSEELDGIM
ncbi:MAG TPA: helix-turn-helix transcriptional regulator [Arenibacter sp.]|nr:helix-turn-helix transcriptional regulator [Arenibacter sp.]